MSGKTSLELLGLFVGQRNCHAIGGNAVPDFLDQRKAIFYVEAIDAQRFQ